MGTILSLVNILNLSIYFILTILITKMVRRRWILPQLHPNVKKITAGRNSFYWSVGSVPFTIKYLYIIGIIGPTNYYNSIYLSFSFSSIKIKIWGFVTRNEGTSQPFKEGRFFPIKPYWSNFSWDGILQASNPLADK